MIEPIIEAVRAGAPLVHCVSATVSMGIVADGLLAAGARPMMTETAAEGPAMTAVADALLINFGTLSEDARRGMEPIVRSARQAGHAWVMDPTAVGVGPVRSQLAAQLAGQGPAIIRANASEAMALASLCLPGMAAARGSGADSAHAVADAQPAAVALARWSGAVVMVSGARDFITDGQRAIWGDNGDSAATRVTGSGCLLGALSAACLVAATRLGASAMDAAVCATSWLNVAAERAALAARGPGSFRVALVDELALLNGGEVASAAKITEMEVGNWQ